MPSKVRAAFRLLAVGITILLGIGSLATQAGDQARVKAELRELMDMMESIPEAQLREVAEHGDLFQAALDILREEEASGDPNSRYARMALGVLRYLKDPRARDVFIAYLALNRFNDYRWRRAVDFALDTQDQEGERYVQSLLDKKSVPLGWLVQTIGMYGGPGWIDRLKAFPRTDEDEKSGVAFTLDEQIAHMEERYQETRVPGIKAPSNGFPPNNSRPPEPRNEVGSKLVDPTNELPHSGNPRNASPGIWLPAVIASAVATVLLALWGCRWLRRYGNRERN